VTVSFYELFMNHYDRVLNARKELQVRNKGDVRWNAPMTYPIRWRATSPYIAFVIVMDYVTLYRLLMTIDELQILDQ